MKRRTEAEVVFFEDIREKKRIASNIFKRVATRKGGVNSALKTPYHYMTNKQKKQLNGEVISVSIKEVLSNTKFKKLDKKTQKLMLEEWRKKFKDVEIYEKMGIASTTYYRYLNDLEVDGRKVAVKESGDGNTPFRINEYYTLTYNQFKALEKPQKRAVAQIIFDNYSINEVSMEWGIHQGSIRSMKKYYYQEDKISEVNADIKEEGSKEVMVEEESKALTPAVITEHLPTATVDNLVENFFFTFNNRDGDRKSIIRKLKYLLLELEDTDESTKFDVHMTIRGTDQRK